MSHTNSTPNYALPQFLTTDKPAWLTDVNNGYSVIDTAIKAAKDAGDNAQDDATQALSDAADAATAAATADAKGSGAVASIADTFDATATYSVGEYVVYNSLLYKCTVAVTTPGAWTGSANWSRTTIEAIIADINSQVVTNTGAISTINNFLTDQYITFTKGSTMPASLGTPTGDRAGHVCAVHFALMMPAGNYTAGTTIWTVDSSSRPHVEQHALVYLGSNVALVRINTNGTIVFNNNNTLNNDAYLIGELVYLAL